MVNAYLEYKTVEYSYERNSGFSFPDVTICNFNGISSSNLEDATVKYDEVKYFLDMSNGIFNTKVGEIPSSNDLFWSLGDRAVEVGHSLQDFVLRCRF